MIPFIGQHSCFVTDSIELHNEIVNFIQDSDAYTIAAGNLPGGKPIWGSNVSDFNITLIMCSIAQMRHSFATKSVTPYHSVASAFFAGIKMAPKSSDARRSRAEDSDPANMEVSGDGNLSVDDSLYETLSTAEAEETDDGSS